MLITKTKYPLDLLVINELLKAEGKEQVLHQ